MLFLDLYSKKDLVVENYKFSLDTLGNIIIIQDEITLLITYNITLRYCSIRPIDILII
jgi:hypothetical protein